jgi:hypothetical protein
MSTCPQNLARSILTICKSVTFKAKGKAFFPISQGENKVLEAQNINFLIRYGFWNIIFLFLVELGTCLQNLISRRSV